ncbi:ectoine/hydroxyectoine ABC transporter substrate-binding protein EhuB [Burkholderia sp. JPY481]
MKNDSKWRCAFLVAVFALALSATISSAGAQTLGDKVKNDGTVTIGVHNRWPWGYETDSGEVTGLYPDVFKAVTDGMGVKKVDFIVMDFGALIPSLLSRRIDAVASGMAITPARCKQVAFSDPFQANGDALLVKKGNPLKIHSYADIAKNPAIRITDIRGASTTENAVAAGIKHDRIQLYPDIESGLAALLAGRSDALMMGQATAIGLLRDRNTTGVERAMPFTGYVEPNGQEKKNYGAIAFRPTDANFVKLFNESLAKRKADGTIAKIMEKYGFSKDDIPSINVKATALCEASE